MAGTYLKWPINLALKNPPQEVIEFGYSQKRLLILSNEIVLRLMKFPNDFKIMPVNSS
jgi:hypothetical protein